jgi:hypothetical protein
VHAFDLSFIVKQPFLANQGIFLRQIFQANHDIILRRREYEICLKSIKKNWKITICNWLDLETLGFWPIMPKNLPKNCFSQCFYLSPWPTCSNSCRIVGCWIYFILFPLNRDWSALLYTFHHTINHFTLWDIHTLPDIIPRLGRLGFGVKFFSKN